MAFIKCKICGGDVEVVQGKNWGTCDYCGSRVTFPKDSTEQRINLLNRADAFRRQNEFDKAISAYERILEDDQTDAEAHWGAAISRFGIEYVENPVTFERKPTLHRLQTTSILADEDYKAAIENAPDDETRKLYEAQAQEIADIQKKVLEQSEREDQFDIFISYKESDANGERTRDSVIAFQIYTELVKEGYNVFFAKETLKGRLGDEYEPIIFSALRSSQVMILIGTKKEYFEAEWVRNEWTRYLDLMRQEKDKPLDDQIPRQLIPCYRDMDAYELPVELNMLQSMNMNSISFLQDLLSGIRKIMEGGNQETYKYKTDEISRLLQRAMNQAELGEFGRADSLAEKVLESDPNNATAQMVKLLVQLKVNTPDELVKQKQPLTHNRLYIMACRNAKGAQKKRYEGYNKKIIANIEAAENQKKLDTILKKIEGIKARSKKLAADDDEGFRKLSEEVREQVTALEQLGIFGGADEKAKEFAKLADDIDHDLKVRIEDRQRRIEEEKQRQQAIREEEARKKAEKEKAEREAKEAAEKAERERLAKLRRRKARKRLAAFLAVLAIAAAITAYKLYFENKLAYAAAVDTIEQSTESRQLDYAETILDRLGSDYEDVSARKQQVSADRRFLSNYHRQAYADYMALDEKYRTPGKLDWYEKEYQSGLSMISGQQFENAIALLKNIDYYKDAPDQVRRAYLLMGDAAMARDQYTDAASAYRSAGDYQDAARKISQTEAAILFAQGRYADAYAAYKALAGEYFTPKHKAWYDQQYDNAKKYLDSGEYQKAIEAFDAIRYYSETGRNAAEQLQNAHYSYAAQSKDPAVAREQYALAGNYRDSESLIRQLDADDLFEAGRYEQAYQLYQTLDEKYQTHKADYTAWFDAANKAMTENGDLELAIRSFRNITYMDSAEYPVKQRLQTAYLTYAQSLLQPTGKIDETAVARAKTYFDLAGVSGDDQVSRYYYETGVKALENDDVRTAEKAFAGAEGYPDTDQLIKAHYYESAKTAMAGDNAEEAAELLRRAGGYQDADALLKQLEAYVNAKELLKQQKMIEAMRAFTEAGDCMDAPTLAQRCGELVYNGAMKQPLAERLEILRQLGDFKDAQAQVKAAEDAYEQAEQAYSAGQYAEAARLFESLDNYREAKSKLDLSLYCYAGELLIKEDYAAALDIYESLGDYLNSRSNAATCQAKLAESQQGSENGD